MEATTHRTHTANHTIDHPFLGPIQTTRKRNKAAHGNITMVETCSCEAQRFTNINGTHTERGSWQR
jgi:hypothetical protein